MPATLRADQGGTRSVLGWLSLPSGTTTDDTVNHIIVAAEFPVGGGTVPVWATDHSPQLYGYSIAGWSTAANRWLPAPPNLIGPDGQHYVYLHADGTIRLAATDLSEAIVSNPNKLTPLAYTSTGVVLTSSEIASNGLWMLDPGTHAITVITPQSGSLNWTEVSNGVAWGTDSPGVLGYPPATNVMEAALQPASRPISAYTAPSGDSVSLIATDRQGGVLAVVTGSSPGLIYIAPGKPPAAATAPPGVALGRLGPRHYADAHGIWFVGQTGIFLFAPASGLQSVAPGVTTDVIPAGDCV